MAKKLIAVMLSIMLAVCGCGTTQNTAGSAPGQNTAATAAPEAPESSDAADTAESDAAAAYHIAHRYVMVPFTVTEY